MVGWGGGLKNLVPEKDYLVTLDHSVFYILLTSGTYIISFARSESIERMKLERGRNGQREKRGE